MVVGPRAVGGSAVALGLLALLAAGCGSTASPAATAAGPAASLPLGTSVAASGATWAVIPMGRGHDLNQFWQLFVLRGDASRWSLVTPPDVATNGAIAVSLSGTQSLVAGVRPSQLLRFSPVISTGDGGKTWHAGVPDPGLADVPDALAAAPQGGQLLALDRNGQVEQGRTSLKTLTSLRGLAASPAARACAPRALTAVAFGGSGQPLVAASCHRRGVAGIFTDQGGRWSTDRPTLPPSFSGKPVEVLRLVRAGRRLTALLQAGSGSAAQLAVAWQAASGRWTVSASLPATGTVPSSAASSSDVLSSAVGVSGSVAVELPGQRAEILAGPAASWAPLPRLPQGRAVTLALRASGGVDALTADGSLLTAWRLHATGSALSAGHWVKTQATKVPIQYGSSS